MKIRKYLEKNLKGSSVANIVIERNNKRTNVIINTAKPGVVIGRGGEGIEKHKKELAKLTGEDIYISIVETTRFKCSISCRTNSNANRKSCFIQSSAKESYKKYNESRSKRY